MWFNEPLVNVSNRMGSLLNLLLIALVYGDRSFHVDNFAAYDIQCVCVCPASANLWAKHLAEREGKCKNKCEQTISMLVSLRKP